MENFSAFHWIIMIAVVALIMRYTNVLRSPANTLQGRSIRQTGKYFHEVVGESHYQPALKKIGGGKAQFDTVATLILDDKNPYDSQAVRIEIDGQQVGHLSRDAAAMYRKRLARHELGTGPQQVGARLVGGGRKHYGVWLDLPDRLT